MQAERSRLAENILTYVINSTNEHVQNMFYHI